MTNTIYSSPLSLPLTSSLYSIHTSKDLSEPVLSNSRFRIAYNLFSAVGGRDLLTTHLHFPSASKSDTSLPITHAELVVWGGKRGEGDHTQRHSLLECWYGVAHRLFCKLFPKARTMDIIAALKKPH